jgi:hypothetical protein
VRPGRSWHNHTLAAARWGRDTKRYRLVRGYGLFGAVWLQHSWAMDDKYLYETRGACDRYFGVGLNEWEALRQWYSEFLHDSFPRPLALMIQGASTATPSGRSS